MLVRRSGLFRPAFISALAAFIAFGVQKPPSSFAQLSKRPIVAERVPVSEASPPPSAFRKMKADSSVPGRLYAASKDGLKISADGGATWKTMRVAGKQDEVLAVAASSPDHVIVGHEGGLWKTDDGGRIWAELPYPTAGPYIPLAVAIAPSAPATVYVATAADGVFRSDDGGYRWMPIDSGLPRAPPGRVEHVQSLVVSPVDPHVAYAAIDGHGVFATSDGGQSWSDLNDGLPFPLAKTFRRARLATDAKDPLRLYLAFAMPVHSHLTRNRLFVLDAGSDRWVPMSVMLPSNTPIRALTVDGSKNALHLWSEDGVWRVPAPAPGKRR